MFFLQCSGYGKRGTTVWNLKFVQIRPQHQLVYMNKEKLQINKYILTSISQLGGERNMKQRIPINSITSKLVLKSMYASCSTGPFFADHYSHRFEKTQLKFRQEKWLPVKISCIIWNEICKKKKLTQLLP